MSNKEVDLFGRVRLRRSRRGFTLLELLLVIAIIFLLASILLSVLSRARESARRVACQSNLQTVARAILSYCDSNENYFPYAAAKNAPGFGGHQVADWVYWQPSPVIDNIDKGGIGPYLKLSNNPHDLAVLRCPADDLNRDPMNVPAYPFSYVLNALMSSGNNDPGQLSIASANPVTAKKLTNVKDGAQKILVYEEDSRTIDDGNGALFPQTPQSGLLSIRHESMPVRDDPLTNFVVPAGLPRVPNPGASGNVALCDGHVESMTRGSAHSIQHFAPDSASPPWPPNTP